jgi:hypothetical protein
MRSHRKSRRSNRYKCNEGREVDWIPKATNIGRRVITKVIKSYDARGLLDNIFNHALTFVTLALKRVQYI